MYCGLWNEINSLRLGNLTIIGSDNGLSPSWRKAIIWTNVGILLIGLLGSNFNEILIGIQTFSLKKMHLKTSSAKWRPFCLCLSVLMNMMNGCRCHIQYVFLVFFIGYHGNSSQNGNQYLVGNVLLVFFIGHHGKYKLKRNLVAMNSFSTHLLLEETWHCQVRQWEILNPVSVPLSKKTTIYCRGFKSFRKYL